jgi:hypothetical protein
VYINQSSQGSRSLAFDLSTTTFHVLHRYLCIHSTLSLSTTLHQYHQQLKSLAHLQCFHNPNLNLNSISVLHHLPRSLSTGFHCCLPTNTLKTFTSFAELVLLLLTLAFVCAHEDANAIHLRNADSPAPAGRLLKVREEDRRPLPPGPVLGRTPEEDRRPLPPGPLLGRSPDSPIHNRIPAANPKFTHPWPTPPPDRKARSPTPQSGIAKISAHEGPGPKKPLNDRDVPPSHALNVDRNAIVEDREFTHPWPTPPPARKARSPTPQDVNIKYPTYDEGADPRSLLNDRDGPPSNALNVNRDTIAVENKRGQPEPDEFQPPQGLCGGGPFQPTCEEMFGSAPPGLGANLKVAALAMMAVLVAGGVLL